MQKNNQNLKIQFIIDFWKHVSISKAAEMLVIQNGNLIKNRVRFIALLIDSIYHAADLLLCMF